MDNEILRFAQDDVKGKGRARRGDRLSPVRGSIGSSLCMIGVVFREENEILRFARDDTEEKKLSSELGPRFCVILRSEATKNLVC